MVALKYLSDRLYNSFNSLTKKVHSAAVSLLPDSLPQATVYAEYPKATGYPCFCSLHTSGTQLHAKFLALSTRALPIATGMDSKGAEVLVAEN